jgi:prepilin-type processing-associated H-X9-DG protein
VSISLTCACGRQFETRESNVGLGVQCPACGCALTVPKPSLFLEDEWFPFKPELTVISGKAIASLVVGALFFFACLSGVPAILLGQHALSDIRRSGGRVTGRPMAIGGIVLGVIGCLFTLVLAQRLFGEDIEWSRRAMCTNNLKQIGLALHNYLDIHGTFPPAAITDKNGKPLLSWRVAILPYLEFGPLYAKFHLDEPWDSPHNRSLIEPIPSVFACRSDRTRKSGMTEYQAVIGLDTAFTPDFKPLRVQDFTDGTTSTLLIGESRRSVPWTKPADLSFNMGVPLSGLGSYHGRPDEGFNALFADGHVGFIKNTVSPTALDAILTRNGVRVYEPDSF